MRPSDSRVAETLDPGRIADSRGSASHCHDSQPLRKQVFIRGVRIRAFGSWPAAFAAPWLDGIPAQFMGNRSPTPYAAGSAERLPAGTRTRRPRDSGDVTAAAARRTNSGLWVAVASVLVVAKKRLRFRRSARGQERTRSSAARVQGHAWACDHARPTMEGTSATAHARYAVAGARADGRCVAANPVARNHARTGGRVAEAEE